MNVTLKWGCIGRLVVTKSTGIQCGQKSGREFVDVLVATENTVLLIQAKDSPITAATLNRTIDRKKATTDCTCQEGGRPTERINQPTPIWQLH